MLDKAKAKSVVESYGALPEYRIRQSHQHALKADTQVLHKIKTKVIRTLAFAADQTCSFTATDKNLHG
eukprot:6185522-Pleurochrysis_carterae.AAC.1